VQVCRAEACQSVGADALVAHAQRKLGCGLHETAESGVTLDPVFCLGQCAVGPAITVDGKLYGHMTAQRFDALVDALDANSTNSTNSTNSKSQEATA
jgi:formate dehydrogenase subunit gamma